MSRVQEPTRAALTSKARARKRHRRNLTVGAIVTAALVATGGGIAFAATRSTGTDYRTTTAASGNVTETVNLTGTVASASRKDAAFETAGTVKSVAVKVGDSVIAGQTLATLSNSSLDSAITSAQQTVTQAEQTLDSDLTSQSSGSTSTNSSTGSSGKSSTGAGAGSGSGAGAGGGTTSESAAVKKAIADVTAAQTALLAGYKTASADADATDALVTASSPTCAPFVAATISDTADATTAATEIAAAQAALADCKTAISGVLTSEQTTDAAQDNVKDLATALNTAVAALQTALGGSSTTAKTSAAVTGSAATIVLAAAVTTGGGASSGGASTTITAATILSDEAAITAAKAQLAIARNAKTLGTLTSPIAGTVAAVSITTGSSVTAGSTTEVITIIGDDGYVVSSTTTLTGVQQLKVGDAVAITVPSSSKPLAGTVSSIGIVNVSTSTTPSYDVTVSVTDKSASILNGASASMVVTADVAKGVLTVPTSAIHRTSRTYSVYVLKDGKEVATTVKVGASGAELTEITSGISAGTQIVLADVSSTTIGDSTSTTTTSTSGGLSGLGGSTTTGGAGTGGPPSGGFGGNN